ncbi:MAG: elongation factor 1-beta [Candidatus Hydrothermarchaeota archaeon]
MGEVLAILKIMPENVDIKPEHLKERIEERLSKIRIVGYEEEPIAFGLTALKVSVVVEDKEGGISEVEEEIKKIEGVGEIDVVHLSRCL